LFIEVNISTAFNGFVRTNTNTDGPLDHYVVSFSPNGQGTDVHGAGGVSSLYPLHYPQPGYPVHIDDNYQKTLANMRIWALLPTRDPGLLCTVGLTAANGRECMSGMSITGTVPLIMKSSKGITIDVPAGKKVMGSSAVQVLFGDSCASSPHLAGHVQETGTGANALPLRVYVALNNTVDELTNFGTQVASKQAGWIANPDLLPPDVIGGKSAQGFSAADLKATLVGTIVSGKPYSSAEVYASGVVTLPLQQTKSLDRLHAMNQALGKYSATLRQQPRQSGSFVPLEPMPGNSFDPKDTRACWR
jgi:hypothetical protein